MPEWPASAALRALPPAVRMATRVVAGVAVVQLCLAHIHAAALRARLSGCGSPGRRPGPPDCSSESAPLHQGRRPGAAAARAPPGAASKSQRPRPCCVPRPSPGRRGCMIFAVRAAQQAFTELRSKQSKERSCTCHHARRAAPAGGGTSAGQSTEGGVTSSVRVWGEDGEDLRSPSSALPAALEYQGATSGRFCFYCLGEVPASGRAHLIRSTPGPHPTLGRLAVAEHRYPPVLRA